MIFSELPRCPRPGKFVTCKEFLERVEYPDHVRQYHAGEYLSSSLVYAVAAREKNAISRVANAGNCKESKRPGSSAKCSARFSLEVKTYRSL